VSAASAALSEATDTDGVAYCLGAGSRDERDMEGTHRGDERRWEELKSAEQKRREKTSRSRAGEKSVTGHCRVEWSRARFCGGTSASLSCKSSGSAATENMRHNQKPSGIDEQTGFMIKLSYK
jgi:hypothetical protein